MDKSTFQLTQPDLDFLHTQWNTLTARYSSTQSVSEDLFNSIVENYSAKNRAYHNLSHIKALLSLSESLTSNLQDHEAVWFAIWFHDLIYNTRKSDNEEKSAEVAVEALTRLAVPEPTIAIVRDMILATKHHSGNNLSWDMKAFLDLDISILGASEGIYIEYSRAIKAEYAWVPGFLYRRKRKEILNDFLGRECLYFTEEMQKRYELKARQNIANEISALSE